MIFNTLISPEELHRMIGWTELVVVDTRFSLADTARGRKDYTRSHIPGAVYADLNEDLAAPVVPGVTGRHPLPDIPVFVKKLSEWGIGEGVQVVVYDDADGAMAARLWWMLVWLGHDAVAVLNGGWKRWTELGFPVTDEQPRTEGRSFEPCPRTEMVASIEDVLSVVDDPRFVLLDARAPERFRGEIEPLDPVAGHIPSARSFPYVGNLDAQASFLEPEQLGKRFDSLAGPKDMQKVICYCGSGVTAAHNVLALLHAGRGMARLYPGSWSEWITDPKRPVVRGA